MRWRKALAVSVAILIASGCASPEEQAAVPSGVGVRTATPTATATPEPTSIPPAVYVEPESISTPVPVYRVAPPPSSAISAAGAVSDGIPWYVPSHRHADYLACLSHPDRFAFEAWIATKDWPLDETRYIGGKEGGGDLCQFNKQGSGACGWFQLLTCPPDGLTPEGQIAGAYNKWLDGGGSFQRHWYNHWE